MSNLITASEAFQQLKDPNTVIADVRFVLGEPAAGYNAYLLGHIPGAVFFDLNTDLSGPKMIHGGGHPLPHPDLFADKLGQAGIDEHTNVIVYDDQGGSIASRLWWMLKYAGHERVRLLSGGFSEWEAAGYPVDAELPQRAAKRFVNRFNESLLAAMSEVKNGIGQAGRVLIDSRVPERYTGKDTSKYAKAGHIPGAINHYWEEGSPSGVFLGASHQRERFRDIPADQEIIVYCGAGVTACPNILALTEAGFKNVKLYIGSWSDWISYEGNPVAVGEEKEQQDL
ncbi:thiosulfate sulfurtransferase [Paenibacillus baekrokdamisoli]|uniref:Thiosulfate sulfurtransferase n=1 Tax=Paenibacillus baekrokdamisoli TaxID=1712516 RepID=A0A3G9JJW3_9BACL|nr:sulfurtransferase [Paenibacillus baekrokdamisoli]MBB3073296.1 thiosulfate/3-mercaptopyruvate sulfurtransferase [Paenibacillus baekrokdamisoli]BBH23274.1 thiosulfate sulfurtransferase [Paenibacillus baekrokdamisoli]